MSLKVMKVVAISAQVPDQPGMAAQVAAALRERGIALKALWGWPSGAGTATLVGVPENPAALKALAASEGYAVTETPMVWVEGPDETGALCPFLTRVCNAGINIRKMMAIGAGGTFGALFGFEDEETVDRVIALMGSS